MSEPLFSHGQWRRDATVDQVVAEVVSDSAWGFAEDPMSFIGSCSTNAAYTAGTRRAFWVQVGLRLCAIAGVEPGSVLGAYADELGLRR